MLIAHLWTYFYLKDNFLSRISLGTFIFGHSVEGGVWELTSIEVKKAISRYFSI